MYLANSRYYIHKGTLRTINYNISESDILFQLGPNASNYISTKDIIEYSALRCETLPDLEHTCVFCGCYVIDTPDNIHICTPAPSFSTLINLT